MEKNGIYISADLLKIIILILSAIFSLGLGVITYFLSNLISDLKKADKSIEDGLNSVNLQLNTLKIEFKSFKETFE